MRAVVLSLLALLASPAIYTAQAPPTAPAPGAKSAFTAEDLLKVATVSVLDLSEDGRRAAVAVRRLYDNAEVDNTRYGDPTYVAPAWVRVLVIDTRSGATATPFKDLVNLQQASWSHDGRRLALLTAVNGGAPAIGQPSLPLVRLAVWDADRATLSEVAVKGDLALSANSGLEWLPGDRGLVVSLRSSQADRDAARRFKTLTQGPVIVHTSSDPFLEWDALRRDLRRRTIAELDPASGQVTPLLPETLVSSYALARDGSFVTFLQDVTQKTDYSQINGTVNDVRWVGREAVPVRTIADGTDLDGATLRWSDDGRAFAYARKGEVFVQRVDEARPRSLTPDVTEKPAAPLAGAASRSAGAPPAPPSTPPPAGGDQKEPFSVVSFSRDGTVLLATTKKAWYVIRVADGSRRPLVTFDPGAEETTPKLEPVAWSPDGESLFATWSARDTWQRGLVRINVVNGELAPLVRDARLFGGFRFSRDGGTIVFTASDGDQPAELYAADPGFTNVRQLTRVNEWVGASRRLPRSELVSYRDADGKLLRGVLRYPVNYVKGQAYPTVFEIYETFFDNGFNGRAAFLANQGYAVVQPSVNLIETRPGEAWLKGVTAAANRLVEMGVADPDRLGVHGTSYGGYATCLLVTQTDRFKAAINISGKVDMVSFYTDSPRLGVRNIHAPEKSQDRLGATLWEHPERYLDQSAILHADRIKTPLLCITGDQDPNVPASQSREMYYALRRLGKDVEWVRYANGAHRPPDSVAESIDFEQRIAGWYDRYLKKKTEDRR
jgi:dipeptidyl aminopeptidase/acylaminoacyl peptidase